MSSFAVANSELDELEVQVYQNPAGAEGLVRAAVSEGLLDDVHGHVVLAKALYQRNEFQASMSELALAEPFAQIELQPQLYAQIRSLVAQNYYRMGSMDQSMIAARDALRALESVSDPALTAQVHNIIGAVHLASGERAPARANFERSLRGFEALGARPEIAKLHNNLGVLHIEDGQLDLAEPHLQTSLSMARELGRTTTIIANLVNLSELHAKRGETDAAREAVSDCFATANAADDESSLVWCHEAASFQLRSKGELEQAVAQSREALTYAERFGLQQHVVDSARALAGMFTEMNLHEEAAAMNDRAFVIMDAIRDQLLKLRLQQSNAVIDYERAKSEVRALRLQDDYQRGLQQLMFASLAVLIPMLLISLWLLRSRGRAVRALAELSASNERLALTDTLTGLPNRRAFLKELSDRSQPLASAGDHGLLMIDVDHFKS
ncbi:MAG: tetratricopeptide repeat protein, partial [Xanthomonadales bacterium]|nr:tetratricopeptide repeat protein [Xanthomonadales bacterium]